MLEQWRRLEWRDLWCILCGHASGQQSTERRTPKRTRAETSSLNGFLRFLRLQANIQLEVVDIGVEALCCFCNVLIGVPLKKDSYAMRRPRIRFQVGILRESVFLRLRPRNCDDDNKIRLSTVRRGWKDSRSHTLRNSFNEQTPHRRLDSMPMISCNLMV